MQTRIRSCVPHDGWMPWSRRYPSSWRSTTSAVSRRARSSRAATARELRCQRPRLTRIEHPHPCLAKEPLVQREIELQDVDVRLPKEAEGSILCVLRDQRVYLVDGKAPRLGDVRRLKFGVAGADVGVEARSGP